MQEVQREVEDDEKKAKKGTIAEEGEQAKPQAAQHVLKKKQEG